MTVSEYNQCVHNHADALYRFILKNIKIVDDAKDVIQNAYEKLWIHKDEVIADKAKSYLFTIAYHKMIDNIRSKKRTVYVDELFEKEAINEPIKNFDTKALIQKALDKLNETQRMLIMLKDYEGYSYQEISAITSLNESQVKVYLHRARIAIKNYLVSIHSIL